MVKKIGRLGFRTTGELQIQAIGWLRKKSCSLRGGTGSMISANLEVIRETPVEKYAGRPCL